MSSTTIILALLAMAVIALADLSLKQPAGKISPSLGTLIYAATSIVIPLAWAAWTKRTSGLNASVEGVCWSVAVGLLFSVTLRFASDIPWDLARALLAGAAFAALRAGIRLPWVVLAGAAVSFFMM